MLTISLAVQLLLSLSLYEWIVLVNSLNLNQRIKMELNNFVFYVYSIFLYERIQVVLC